MTRRSVRKWVSFLLVASVPFVGATDVWAKHHRGHGHGAEMKKMLQGLDLSEEQRKEIKEIRKKAREKRKAQRVKVKKAHEALIAAFEKSASESSIRELHEEFHEQKEEVMKIRFETMLKVRAKLTDEQRKKFDATHAKLHRERMARKKK